MAFIDMCELAARAEAYDESAATPADAWSFWTACFLRLGRCRVTVPWALEGPGGLDYIHMRALQQLVLECAAFYEDASVPVEGVPAVAIIGRAAVRLLEDSGCDIHPLSRALHIGRPGFFERALQPVLERCVQEGDQWQ